MNRSNWGVDFAGDNDYITITEYTGVDMTTGGITIEFWVNPDNITGFHGYVSKSNTADTQIQYNIFSFNNGKIRFYFYTGSAQQQWETTSEVLTAGTWKHVAFTFTFGTGSSIKCYINDVDTGGSWVSGSGNFNSVNNAEAVKIGAYNTSTGYLNGKMADVRIWNVVRTQTEIIQNMYKRLLGTESNLQGYWPLDEGTGTTATNSVSGGNNGTLTNFSGTYWVDGAPISGNGSNL